jgi:formylglycine-generating enzyme required for sulfatase activity
MGDGPGAGSALTADPRVGVVRSTGSVAAGRAGLRWSRRYRGRPRGRPVRQRPGAAKSERVCWLSGATRGRRRWPCRVSLYPERGTGAVLHQHLNFGNLWLNIHVVVGPDYPVGCLNESGHGKEGGATGIDEFTRIKQVGIKLGNWYKLQGRCRAASRPAAPPWKNRNRLAT